MNKKNSKVFILVGIIFVVLLGVGLYIYYNSSGTNNSQNYEANRTSTTDNVNNSENTANVDDKNNPSNNDANSNKEAENQEKPETPAPPTPVEEEISKFSTKIYSSDSVRQNNINITCGTLNGTIVKVGDTFSFCNTVGQATTEKGYQKADIFDKNGNKKKGLGGGNCQISTTLYNALLAVPSLEVTERHKHSNYVPYIEKGKDAAVAYGSYDLKFVNKSETDVKINCSSDGHSVTVSLIALKNAS